MNFAFRYWSLIRISSLVLRIYTTRYWQLHTGGAPKGEFLIAAGEIEKAVEIVSTEDMPIPTPTPTPSSSPIPSPSPSPISSPQKITKPFPIPCVGFEAIGCIAIAAQIMAIRKGFGNMNQRKGPGQKCHIPKGLYIPSTNHYR